MDILPLHQKFCEIRLYRDGFRPRTIQTYQYSIKLLIKENSITQLEEVTSTVIENFFIKGRREKKWSEATFNVHRKSLIPFFKWCLEKKYIPKRKYPFTHLKALKIKSAQKKPLTPSETKRLLAFTGECAYKNNSDFLLCRNKAIIATLIYAGLRASELLTLLLQDIDFEEKEIFVRYAKGGKSRTVPMHKELEPFLKNYLKERQLAQKTCPELFASYTLNRQFTYSGLMKLVRRLRKESGIYFYSHKLRRTFSSLMAESGCEKWALKEMMGHENIETTDKIYVNVRKEFIKEQSEKFHLNGSEKKQPTIEQVNPSSEIANKLEHRLLKIQLEQEILRELISNQ